MAASMSEELVNTADNGRHAQIATDTTNLLQAFFDRLAEKHLLAEGASARFNLAEIVSIM
jgi:hypothetical protein